MNAALARDLTAAWRRLARAPGYAALVVVLLAFALGANIVLGSAVHAMRFKALPFADGDRLAVVQTELRKLGMTLPTSVYLLDRLEREGTGFTASGYSDAVTLAAGEGAAPWQVAPIRPRLLDLLGVSPAMGRAFTADDAQVGAAPALIVSHNTWQSRLHGDPGVLGRTIKLADATYTVVGVMPPGFAFPDRATQAWSPFAFTPEAMAQAREGNVGGASTLLRLAPGTTLTQARERVAGLFANDATLQGMRAGAGLDFGVIGLREYWTGDRGNSLWLLQGALLLVLLAVVTNVASLMFERLLARQQELGVRAAIGAGRGRLVVAAAAESWWLLLAGAAIGTALAPAGLRLLASAGAIDAAVPFEFGSAGDIVAVSALMAGVAAIAFSLVPLIALSGAGAALALRPGVPARHETRGVARLRRGLVVAQLAITTVLLTGAGLMTRSVVNLLQADTGFDRRQVLVTTVVPRGGDAPAPSLDGDALAPLLARAAALPGVRSAAYANMAPLSQSESMSNYALPGQGDALGQNARTWAVGPGWFDTLGIALQEGHDFTASDLAGDAPVVIVDTLFAERHFAGRPALGQTIRVAARDGKGLRDAQIVGVAQAVRHRTLDELPDKPSLYQPFANKRMFSLVLRSEVDPATLVAPVRALVTAALPQFEVRMAMPMSELARQSVRDRESVLRLLAGFAAVAALVSAIGLYALMAVTVRRRAVEIGVRQALGADPRQLRRWVMAQAWRVALIGVAVGVLGGAMLARSLTASLYGVTAQDPLTFVAVAALVLVIAVLATLVPARRAARMDPQACLRAQ